MRNLLARLLGNPKVILALAATGMRFVGISLAGTGAEATNWPGVVSTNNPRRTAGEGKPQAQAALPVETAFVKGLAAVGGRFNVYGPEGWIGLRRTTTNAWAMTFHRHRGPDTNAIRLIVKDDGSVESSEDSPSVAQPPPDAKIPSPRAAFRKALRSLRGRVDFTEPIGQISFWRSTRHEWQIKLSGFKGLWVNGLMLSVGDDLRVTEVSAP